MTRWFPKHVKRHGIGGRDGLRLTQEIGWPAVVLKGYGFRQIGHRDYFRNEERESDIILELETSLAKTA